MFTRRLFCASLLFAPFAFNCGGDEREESTDSTAPQSDEPVPPRDLDHPEPSSPSPEQPVLVEPDVRAEGVSNMDVADEPDVVSVLDDLYDRVGEANVELSDAWKDFFGQPAVVELRVGDRVLEDCLYFTFDDESVLGPDAGVLMAVDRSQTAVTWWCGAERLEL
ncbi:MAG: hypothetical protein Q7S89_01355 [bacterium]|nr:hypothetical protein [bacterium]